MKITKTIEAVEQGKRRKAVILDVELGPMAKSRVREMLIVPTTPSIPMPLYQHPDGTITLATDRKIYGQQRPYEAFRLRTARVRSYSKGCSLQVGVGRVLLGYINPSDEDVADAWLDKVIAELDVLVPDVVKKAMESAKGATTPTRTAVVEKDIEGIDFTPVRAERSFR